MGPIIARTTTVLGHEYVLRVVQVRKRRRQYIIDDLPRRACICISESNDNISIGKTHPWLEVNENCTGNIMFIVCLIEKHVFTVAPLCRPFLEDALFVDAMLGAKPLPEDGAHCKVPMSVVKLS